MPPLTQWPAHHEGGEDHDAGGAIAPPLSKLMANAPVANGDAEPISDSGAHFSSSAKATEKA